MSGRLWKRVAACVALLVAAASLAPEASALASIQLIMTGETPAQRSEPSDPVRVTDTLSPLATNCCLSGFISASADAADGTLRVTKAISYVGSAGHTPTSPTASARLYDRLTISGPASSITFHANLEINGNFDAVFGGGDTISEMLFGRIRVLGLSMVSDNATSTAIFSRYGNDNQVDPRTDTADGVVNATRGGVDVTDASGSTIGTSLTVNTAHLVLETTVPTGVPFDFDADLVANDGFGSVGSQIGVDFGDTARLSIELPPGYSFTSESGVLLVPEPAMPLLLAAGAATLALVAPRKLHRP